MKRGYLGLIFIFLLFGVVSPLECIDSDSKDIFIKGIVYGNDSNNQPYSFQDYCSGDLNSELVEYSCDSVSGLIITNYICPLNMVCNYGACIDKELSGECIDSDNKIEPMIKGEISGFYGLEGSYSYSDSCNDVYLEEYYCNPGGEYKSVSWDCSPGKCNEGKCVESETLINNSEEKTNKVLIDNPNQEEVFSLITFGKYLFIALVLLAVFILVIFIIFSEINKRKKNKLNSRKIIKRKRT
jgi:preprotein translocase subunit SecG